ncbi:MAG: hypothetical protein U9R44_03655 [Candidatus Omnitrophota bacterium]|nr:hypothetical protein [Candidatus Omnitrophota bacterium]
MRARILANRVNLKELIPVILCMGIYIIVFYPSVFAEHINVPEKSGVAGNITSKSYVSPQQGEWRTEKSAYFDIYYRPDAKLKKIERKLRRRVGFYDRKDLSTGFLNSIEKKIAYRMDLLFSRAKDILGMYPRVKGVKIMILKDRKELNAEYYRIFGERQNFKSFYIYKHNTIYTTEKDISDSVLAHEMGHVIVDHFFVVRPPEQVRELLAQYVDLHLEDAGY